MPIRTSDGFTEMLLRPRLQCFVVNKTERIFGMEFAGTSDEPGPVTNNDRGFGCKATLDLSHFRTADREALKTAPKPPIRKGSSNSREE